MFYSFRSEGIDSVVVEKFSSRWVGGWVCPLSYLKAVLRVKALSFSFYIATKLYCVILEIHAKCWVRSMFIRTLRLKNCHFLRASVILFSCLRQNIDVYKKNLVCSWNIKNNRPLFKRNPHPGQKMNIEQYTFFISKLLPRNLACIFYSIYIYIYCEDTGHKMILKKSRPTPQK